MRERRNKNRPRSSRISEDWRRVYVAWRNLRMRWSKSALISSGTVARPRGVISATSSSTVIFSRPLLRITSVVEREGRGRRQQLRRCRGARRRGLPRGPPTFAVLLQFVAPPALDQLCAQQLLEPEESAQIFSATSEHLAAAGAVRDPPCTHCRAADSPPRARAHPGAGERAKARAFQAHLSFSPVSISFCMIVARTASSLRARSACDLGGRDRARAQRGDATETERGPLTR